MTWHLLCLCSKGNVWPAGGGEQLGWNLTTVSFPGMATGINASGCRTLGGCGEYRAGQEQVRWGTCCSHILCAPCLPPGAPSTCQLPASILPAHFCVQCSHRTDRYKCAPNSGRAGWAHSKQLMHTFIPWGWHSNPRGTERALAWKPGQSEDPSHWGHWAGLAGESRVRRRPVLWLAPHNDTLQWGGWPYLPD